MRESKYKSEILKFFEHKHTLSLKDIHQCFNDIDFSTIFRNIEKLVTDGELRKIIVGKDQIMYEKNNCCEGNHFICEVCNSVDAIEIGYVDKQNTVHGISVYGVCKKCK